jgi:hypothetical protein
MMKTSAQQISSQYATFLLSLVSAMGRNLSSTETHKRRQFLGIFPSGDVSGASLIYDHRERSFWSR